MKTIDISGLVIFNEGPHGPDRYTGDDLQAMVDAHCRLGFLPPVKLIEDGNDKRIFGSPALGYVSRLYRQGTKLIADLTDVPSKFGEIIKSRKYRKLGAEIFWSYKDEATGKTWPRVLKAITFAADNLRLDSLAIIERLFTNSTAARAYDRQRESKIYNNSIQEDQMDINETWKRYERETRQAAYQNSLTSKSTEFAEEAFRYAVANNCDFPSAVKALMRICREYSDTADNGKN